MIQLKKISVCLFIISCVLIFFATDVRSEFLFLKNGEIIEGEIQYKVKGATFFKHKDGRVKRYADRNILRLLYTKLYMGRQYIRLTNGKVISAYKVGENSEFIIFRKDINKPQEFKIKRSKILFMARKTPLELKGIADYTSIDIDWKPPMGTVKSYNIYVIERHKKYDKKPYAISKNTKITLKGLKSSRKYKIIVTSIDDREKESLPSNEIIIATKNYAPRSVPDIRYVFGEEYNVRRKGKRIRARVVFKAAPDVDGYITKYVVYYNKNGSNKFKKKKIIIFKKQSDVNNKKLFLIIDDMRDNQKFAVKIRAFDNRNAPSSMTSVYRFSTKNQMPNAPRLRVKIALSKAQKMWTYRVSWEKPMDPDGRVVRYNLYVKSAGVFKLKTTTDKLNYEFKETTQYKESDFTLRAIDNRGGISRKSYAMNLLGWHLSADLMTLVPLGTFFDAVHPGVGTLVSFTRNHWPLYGLNLSVETGFFYFFGKHEMFYNYMMIPLLAKVQYSFDIGSFTLGVSAAGGGSVSMVVYNRFSGGGYLYNVPDGINVAIQPMIMGGLSFTYSFDEFFSLGMAVNYGGVIESSGLVQFLTVAVRADFKVF